MKERGRMRPSSPNTRPSSPASAPVLRSAPGSHRMRHSSPVSALSLRDVRKSHHCCHATCCAPCCLSLDVLSGARHHRPLPMSSACLKARVREWPSWFLFLATPIVKSTVTVVQLTDFVEIAAMRQFDRVLARVECMRPGSLADKAQSDGRRVMLPARSSRTEAAGGIRAGVRMVQSQGIRVHRRLDGWCIPVCVSTELTSGLSPAGQSTVLI